MTAEYPTPNVRMELRQYLREVFSLAEHPELAPLTLAIYRHLGKGHSVSLSDLSARLGLSVETVESMVAKLPASMFERDTDGSIIAFGGLSLRAANHIFRIADITLHTWCVFDGLFLPQLLGKSATLITHCPMTRRRIEITLAPKSILHAAPEKPVMSCVTPDKKDRYANLRGTFCNHVNLFADDGAFQSWAGDKQGFDKLPLADAHEIALARNHFRFGHLLLDA